MKKVIRNIKKIAMIALALALIGTPFLTTSSLKAQDEVIIVVGPETIKELNLALSKMRANIEGLYTATHDLLHIAHKKTKTNTIKNRILKLEKEMRGIAQSLPSSNLLFHGVKNLALHIADAEKILFGALKANTVVKLIEAINSISTTSFNALEHELYGPTGLFVQFGQLEDKVLEELLKQLTHEVDKLTHLQARSLGHADELALLVFLTSKERGLKGPSGAEVIELQRNGLPTPRKLAR